MAPAERLPERASPQPAAPVATTERGPSAGASAAYLREARLAADDVLRRMAGDDGGATPPVGPEGGELDAGTADALGAMRAGGSPLDEGVRRQMEDGFGGVDLSAVRVHTGPAAAQLNRQVGALAFAQGSHVFFRDGLPDTSTSSGQHLLAHELAHTLQVGGGLQRQIASRHAVTCSCGGCRAGSAQRDGVIHRVLDPRFTSASIRSSGLEPTYFLFKSTYAKLLDALDIYFAATTPVAQYGALLTIQAKIGEFNASSSRGTTRSGTKAQTEQDKVQLVTDLGTAVRLELDALNANPTGELLNMHQGQNQETVVLVVAQNVARRLGLTLDQLAQLPAPTLRDRFIAEIYLPDYMLERAGQKPPGLSVAEQIDQIREVSRVDVTGLTPGSQALVLFTLFETANIGKAVKTASDPKFGQGSEEYTPTVDGWDAGNTITVKGGDDYRAKVIGLVDVIAQTPVGVALLKGIGGKSGAQGQASTAVHPANKASVAVIKPPSVANVNYKDATTGEYMYANSAGGSSATVDAFNDVIGADPGKTQAEPFRLRDAVVGLFHELVHVYVQKVDEPEFVSLEDPNETMRAGQMYEPRVAGIRIKEVRNGKEVTFPFEKPDYNYVSENTFRKEYAELQGEADYYVRPYYLGGTDEVRGPTDKQAV